MSLADEARQFFSLLQDRLCAELERLDGKSRFHEDRWTYEPGEGPGSGGGTTRVIRDGGVFEKGGVNVSAVRGRLSDNLAGRLQVDPQGFFATGVSLVLHPGSPMVPTAHMNLRYLELESGKAWFGGGADLTPYYLYRDDAEYFHRCFREACDAHDAQSYARFKKWCDEYFYLPHREEARGVGGIFFDYLVEDLPAVFAFVQRAGEAFLAAYPPIVERRRDEPYAERERTWQTIRRGRYVEFNLIHDRGTLFGLETRGRTESILMSLPPVVRWEYDHHPDPGSREAELLEVLRSPVDW